jgi:DNA gyrase/topoisomerase IV subunit A
MDSEGFVTIQKKEGTEEIREDLMVYGSSVIADKFPNYVDGLKAIQRRIIWFSKDYDTTKGLNKVIGDIGDFHTGGDSSIYDAIIRLSQPFKVGNALMRVDGKNGEYYDPSAAAAARYLKSKLSEFAYDVYFKGVKWETIPMTPTKDYTAVEPKYLIPRLPMALILGNVTVGFGFKSWVPMIDINDVCDAVMQYATYKSKGNIRVPNPKDYAKCLLPSFPVKILITNKDEILSNYEQGNFNVPIKMEGFCELSGNNLTFRSISFGNDFGKATADLRERLARKEDKWLWDYIVTTSQLSSDDAEFSVTIKSSKNPFEVMDILRPILKFNDVMCPIYNYVYDGKAICLTPMQVLMRWYDERYMSVSNAIKHRQAALINKERMLKAMLTVADHTDKVIDIIKNSDDTKSAAYNLYTAFADKKLSLKQAEIICKQPVGMLAKANRKSITADIEKCKLDQQSNLKSFSVINETIYNDAQALKKKYGKTPSPTMYSNEFKGYIQYGDYGITHFSTDQEMLELLNTKGWGSVKKSIHLYDPRFSNRFIVRNKHLYPMEPTKQIMCSKVICYPDNRQEYSLVISTKEMTASIIEGSIIRDVDGYEIYPVTKKFYSIRKSGEVVEDSVNNYTFRKSVSRGRYEDVIYGMPSYYKDMVIIHMSPLDPNILRIDRILMQDKLGKINFVPGEPPNILGVYPIGKKEIYLNIPEDCRKSVAVDYLIIKEVANIFSNGEEHQLVDLNKSSKLSKMLKRNAQVRNLFTLDFRGQA